MTGESKANIGLTISVALLGVIATLFSIGYADLKGDMQLVHLDVKGVRSLFEVARKDMGNFKVRFAQMEGAHISRSEGIQLWGKVNKLESDYKSLNGKFKGLPPKSTERHINNNTSRIEYIEREMRIRKSNPK